MPAYNTQVPPFAIYPGDEIALFNNEAVAAANNSIQVAIPPSLGGGPAQFMLTVAFAVAPTDTLTVQSAVDDATANYINTAAVSTNKQTDQVSFTTNAAFVRLNVTAYSAGGNLTAKLYRAA